MPRIVLPAAASAGFTEGRAELTVEARTFRQLVRELDERFPGLGAQVDQGMAIAIDGVIYQDAYGAELTEESEIYLIPKIAGG